MSTQSLNGHVLTPDGFVSGALLIDSLGRIAAVQGQACSEEHALASGGPILLPGFVDLHVHGGGGRDTMEAGDAIAHIARLHARHGTTALLATTMTAPLAEIETALAALGGSCRERPSGAARVLGIHLEGPYIDPQRLGAQPDFARAAQLDEILHLHTLAPIRLITLAPEQPGHMGLIAPLCAAGFRVQIGHSNGRYEEGLAALMQGASGFTHLFNAMSGLHHRAPGMVGAALAHARHAEIIPDLLHVHPGAIRVALRAIPGLYCVTDSTAAAGMPDGDYRLGRHTVTKCLGGVRLPDGTLAGSTLTTEASLRTSTLAADFIGATDRGRLQARAWADVVVLDAELRLQQVLIEGQAVEPAPASSTPAHRSLSSTSM